MRANNGNRIHLWSFEVKKQLTLANVRSYFFQTVSNSGWINYSYLVITGLNNDKELECELQMLYGLHGVGILLLDAASLHDS